MQNFISRNTLYDLILILSVTLILCGNLIGPAKLCEGYFPIVGSFFISVVTPLFAVPYLLSAIVCDRWGRASGDWITYAGLMSIALAALVSHFILHIKPLGDPFNMRYQAHLEAIFNDTPRIAVASLCAFLVSMKTNTILMWTLRSKRHRMSWLRIFLPAQCAILVDAIVFYVIAFIDVWPPATLFKIIAAQWLFGAFCQLILVPFICGIANVMWDKEISWVEYRI